MKSLQEIQTEQAEWSAYNFGPSVPSQQLMGIAEEVAELLMSHVSDDDSRKDAIADAGVFLLNYASAKQLDIQECIEKAAAERFTFADVRVDHELDSVVDLQIFIGRLCHHQLKTEQNIRLNENHPEKIKMYVGLMAMALDGVARSYCKSDLLTEINKTWESVRLRDFKKFPNNGRTH